MNRHFFWVRHKVTDEISVAQYIGESRWRHFGVESFLFGLVDYEIIEEIEHLVMDERRHHEHAHHRAATGTLTMTKILNTGGTSTATVSFKDKAGASVNLPAGSVPKWTVDQVALLTVVPSADGLSAEITAVAVGMATITVVAEGDPTPGADTITVAGSVSIVDEASSGELVFS